MRQAAASPDEVRLLVLARKAYGMRRRRDALVGSRLFREPAWDILLAAFIARLEQREMSITALAKAGAAPPTTALRHIALLEGEGLLRRMPPTQHGRRFSIEVTQQCFERMTLIFSTQL